MSSLETRNRVELQHCLETYSLVSRQQAAEQLFLNTIIAPYMTQVCLSVCLSVSVSVYNPGGINQVIDLSF